jgi:hypothetical protein
MKKQNAESAGLSLRCAYRAADGRQCCELAFDAHTGLCPQHRAQQTQMEAADHFPHLTCKSQYFQTAQGINYSLMNLYQLLAENRISPRRASVLAYINSLQLRTLPQIDADNAAGITDPTIVVDASVPTAIPVPDLQSSSAPDSALSSNLASSPDSAPVPEPTPVWDPANPEPDPKKKPS